MDRFHRTTVALLLAIACTAAPELDAQQPSEETAETVQSERILLSAPAGDTIATLWSPAAPVVVEEEAGWVKVSLEGWIRRDSPLAGIGAAAGRTVGLAQLRAEPERFVGQRVRWNVQFVGLQRADSLRSDMPVGQRYMLVRDPGGEAGFVYALLSQNLVHIAEMLVPLQRIQIVARIRTGRSPLTGHPIVELMEIVQ